MGEGHLSKCSKTPNLKYILFYFQERQHKTSKHPSINVLPRQQIPLSRRRIEGDLQTVGQMCARGSRSNSCQTRPGNIPARGRKAMPSGASLRAQRQRKEDKERVWGMTGLPRVGSRRAHSGIKSTSGRDVPLLDVYQLKTWSSSSSVTWKVTL
jgi:hypothetical protein